MRTFLLCCCLFTYSLSYKIEEPSTRNDSLAASSVYSFNFVLTWELSMLYNDDLDGQWNVTMEDDGQLSYTPNGTKIPLRSEDVNTLDGFQTKYIAINGQMPGPTIEVPLHSTVYVHVKNNLMSDSATIHWHGLLQKDTQWSDGIPYVTECPIPPGTSYSYKFIAAEAGTFWYHSHLAMQRMDGLFGALIVHDMTIPSYQSFTVQVHDWLHIDGNQFATELYGPGDEVIAYYEPNPDRYDDLAEKSDHDLASDSFLINGRGRYGNNSAPLTVHKVSAGEQYLFRFINTGFDNMVKVSVDDHKMTVIGTDSSEVEPVVVDFVWLAIGERVNVLITADQPEDNYWVRFRPPRKTETPQGHSIISYTTINTDPTTNTKECTTDDVCVALNCPFSTAEGWRCIPISSLQSTSYHSDEIALISGMDVSEHFLAYTDTAGDTINGRAMHLPSSPFYQQDYKSTGIVCDDALCNTEGCACTHVRTLPPRQIVQIVVMHHVLLHFIHTWHMHGYRFAVLKVVYPPRDDSNGLIKSTFDRDIKCSNALCYDCRWTNSSYGNFEVNRPPIKDTVFIPIGGYAVIRLFTDNPGYWMGHCHQSDHLHEGMAMVFDVEAEKVDVPKGFPTCGNFILNADETPYIKTSTGPYMKTSTGPYITTSTGTVPIPTFFCLMFACVYFL